MAMKAADAFETPRLTLRRPTAADAVRVFERYAGDPEVTRYLAWPRHRSLADTEGFLRFSAAEWKRSGVGPYLICSSEDGYLLGSTGLALQEAGEAVTGYVLAKDAWGRGYATETLQAMVLLSEQMGVRRLRAFCHPDHRASWHVLAKCGFTRDASWSEKVEFPNLAPGLLQDVLCYERVFPRGDK